MCLATWFFAETDGESAVDGLTCFSSSMMFNGATEACVFLSFTRWITTAEKSDGATIRRNNVLSLTQISNDHKCHPAVALHCGHAGRVTLPVKRLQWRANAEWAVPRFLARPRGPRDG